MERNPFKFDIFVSYSRHDNASSDPHTPGWVTEFCRVLSNDYQQETGVDLRLFFDKQSIAAGSDWKERLGEGIRQSHLFLAFLSENYFRSPYTLWEWERYLNLEHGAARGNDGVIQVFFVTPEELASRSESVDPDLMTSSDMYGERQTPGEQLEIYRERVNQFKSDLLERRNRTEMLDLSPWFQSGPAALREEDAKQRAQEFNPTPPSLPYRVHQISSHCAQRLARVALAEACPGNVARAHEHFVGRHDKLRQIHEAMLAGSSATGNKGRSGAAAMACLHGLGGTGKSALARQYAHAYAEFYVVGGIWEIDCEGSTNLLETMQSLSGNAEFTEFLRDTGVNFSYKDDAAVASSTAQDSPAITENESVYSKIDKAMQLRVSNGRLNELALRRPAKCLLILDNVDQDTLLTSHQLAHLPMGGWMDFIVTTRINPMLLGFGERWATAIEIAELRESEAIQLFEEHLPNRRFPNEEEVLAATALAERLGGWALAVDLAGSYIGTLYTSGLTFSEYLSSLESANGASASLSVLPEARYGSSRIRHAEPNIGTIIEWSISKLNQRSLEFLAISAFMNTNAVPIEWVWSIIDEQNLVGVSDKDKNHTVKANRIEQAEIIASLSAFHLASHLANDGNSNSVSHIRIHNIVAEYVRVFAANHGLTAGSSAARFFNNRMMSSQVDDLLTTGMNPHIQLVENLFSVIKTTLSENDENLSADLIRGLNSAVNVGLEKSLNFVTRPIECFSVLLTLMSTQKGWSRNEYYFPSGYFYMELTLQRARLARLQGSDFYDASNDLGEMYIYSVQTALKDWASLNSSGDTKYCNRHLSYPYKFVLELYELWATTVLQRGGPRDIDLCEKASIRYLQLVRTFHDLHQKESKSRAFDAGNIKQFALFLSQQAEPALCAVAIDMANFFEELDDTQKSTSADDCNEKLKSSSKGTIHSTARTSVESARYVHFDPSQPFGDFKLVKELPESTMRFTTRSGSAGQINTHIKSGHKAVRAYFGDPRIGLKEAAVNYRMALDLLEEEREWQQKQEDCSLSYNSTIERIFHQFPLVIMDDIDDPKGWTTLFFLWATSPFVVLHQREIWDQYSASIQAKAKAYFRMGVLLQVYNVNGAKVSALDLLKDASKFFALVYRVQPTSLAKRRNLIVSTRRYVIARTHERLKDHKSKLDESIDSLSERCEKPNASWLVNSKIDRTGIKQHIDECLLLAELLHHRATIGFDKHRLLFVKAPWSIKDLLLLWKSKDSQRAQHAFDRAFNASRTLTMSDLSQIADGEQFAFIGVRLADYHYYSKRTGYLKKATELFADVIQVIQNSEWDPDKEGNDSVPDHSIIKPLYYFAKARLKEEQEKLQE